MVLQLYFEECESSQLYFFLHSGIKHTSELDEEMEFEELLLFESELLQFAIAATTTTNKSDKKKITNIIKSKLLLAILYQDEYFR